MTSTAASHSLGWAGVATAPEEAAAERRQEEAARAEAGIGGLPAVRFSAGAGAAYPLLGILLATALLWACFIAATS
jgi:hypothetical protein